MAGQGKWVTEEFGKRSLAKNCAGEIAWLASYESSTPDPRGVESTRFPEICAGFLRLGAAMRVGLRLASIWRGGRLDLRLRRLAGR